MRLTDNRWHGDERDYDRDHVSVTTVYANNDVQVDIIVKPIHVNHRNGDIIMLIGSMKASMLVRVGVHLSNFKQRS